MSRGRIRAIAAKAARIKAIRVSDAPAMLLSDIARDSSPIKTPKEEIAREKALLARSKRIFL